MAFEKVRPYQYICDTKEDLKNIPEKKMGVECFVIKEACEYMLMSNGEWIKQIVNNSGNTGSDIDLSDYVTKEELTNELNGLVIPSIDGLATEEYVEEAIASIKLPSVEEDLKAFKEELKVCYRPVKYDITNVPEGTIVDYRDKEIRIYCPENVEFHKQAVGEGGSENMYYMTFTSYAPEGAVSLREGDRGVILDEVISLENGTGTGVDKFGRKYKKHWFALASYDAASDTWNYFGKTSTTSKYIGWTYVVAWYDENNRMIDTDILRINLSNKNCHLTLENSYYEEENTIWAELPE